MKKLITFFLLGTLLACHKDVPELPLNVDIVPGFNKANLYWENLFDKSETVLYQIYLNDQLVGESENIYHYEITGLEENTSYTGWIQATNQSGKTKSSEHFTFSTTINHPPSDFSITITKINSTEISFEWTRSVDPDEGTTTYSVFLADKMLAENLTDQEYTITGLDPETSYKIVVAASDVQGNKTEAPASAKTLKTGAEISQNFGEFVGYKREYCIYQPSNPGGSKLPLVIYLHGWSNVIWPGMLSDYFPEVAERENFLLLMPQGKAAQGGEPAWDSHNTGHWNDTYFLSQLIDLMISDYNVDDQRVYVCGFSNGGFMTFYLSQALEERLAAIAPIAGLMDLTNYAKYSLNKPMPLCYIHGTADSIVKVEGDVGHVSFATVLDYFIQKNGANPTPVVTQLPDIYPYDNSNVTKIEYPTTLNSSADIVYYRINNGDHSIPGRSWANRDIHAFDVIWDFFKPRKLSDK